MIMKTYVDARSPSPTSLTAAPQLVLFPPPTAAGLGEVSATLTSGSVPLAKQTVSFSEGGSALCSAVTSQAGVASCSLSLTQELGVLLAGGYRASFAGEGDYLPSGASTPAIELGSGLAAAAARAAHRKAASVSGTLTRGRQVYATVTTRARHGHASVRLEPHRRLRAGRYLLSLRIAGGEQIRRTISVR
jgi:hypothetical protein